MIYCIRTFGLALALSALYALLRQFWGKEIAATSFLIGIVLIVSSK